MVLERRGRPQELTLHSPHEAAWATLMGYVDNQRLTSFLNAKGSKVTSAELQSLLMTRVKAGFPDQWRSETRPHWQGRSGLYALRETILHLTSHIAIDAGLRSEDPPKQDRKGFSKMYWLVVGNRAVLMGAYFGKQLPNVKN